MQALAGRAAFARPSPLAMPYSGLVSGEIREVGAKLLSSTPARISLAQVYRDRSRSR